LRMRASASRSGTGFAPIKSMLVRALSIIGVLLSVAAAVDAAPTIKVGMLTRTYADEARKAWEGTDPRPLVTVIWYPAAPSRKVEYVFEGPVETQVFDSVPVATDAPIARTKAKYPLVLLSHGTGSSALQLIWFAHHLASRGYIAAAVNHHGNTAAEKQYLPQGFALVWERPKDLSVVLDKLLADPVFGPRIDVDRIGVAGFSLGGYSAIALAGGKYSPDSFDAFCRSPERDFTCDPQPEFPEASARMVELRKSDLQVNESIARSNDSYRDARIKAVFAMAPVLAHGFTQHRLTDVNVPVRIVVGEADKVAPMQTNALHYAQLIPQADLSVLHGNVGHYEFLATCTAYGRRNVAICKDAPGVNRPFLHREVANMAFGFFESAWKRTQ
jgi:predicted dienelactone hydrolase